MIQGNEERNRRRVWWRMEKVAMSLISEEILMKRLDLEGLCSVACVNRALRLAVDSQVLPRLSSVSLSSDSESGLKIIPDAATLRHILTRCRLRSLHTLILNCQRLHHSSLAPFLAPQIQHLHLFSCSSISPPPFLSAVAQNCPFLRVLTLEFTDHGGSPLLFNANLSYMLSSCQCLESLSIKIRGTRTGIPVFDAAAAFRSIESFLPTSIKLLKLKPMLEDDAIRLASKLTLHPNSSSTTPFLPPSPSSAFTLQSLSLVLDILSDTLLLTITNSLPLLLNLELEDRPDKEPSPHRDLTNTGLHSLASCQHLSSLSLIRSRQNYQASFKSINDMGVFMLSESCKALQSVRLCGFSKVTDAGYASLLHSCQQLKKFEVRNASFLSDLAFDNLMGAPCGLVEVRLLSCSLITSETVKKLASSRSLEVLDMCGCKSIADSCLKSISRLQRLTTLNLSGADITDSGLCILGQGKPPITHLSLRGCKRVTDRGISLLLCGGGVIGQTLTSLDLGYMPRISDNAILTIAAAGREITELCIRYCFYVTDSSLQALATKRRIQDGSKQLYRLDLYNCIGLSADALKLLRRPLFRGMYWVGIGKTRLASKGDAVITEICEERPWLTVCLEGCEMGCHDGWQFHGLKSN